MNKFIKALGREAGWRALIFSDRMIRWFPGKIVLIIMNGIGMAAYLFCGYRRRVALDNLRHVFGREKNRGEIKGIMKLFIRGIIANHYELVALYHNGNRDIREIVSIEGKENLDRALEKGRGVIAVSAHIGNFEIVCGRMVAEGYRYSAMAASARDERAKKYFADIWERQGMDIIPSLPVFTALRRSIETLEKNGLIAIYADQNRPSGGIFIDFFGRLAATATSPAALAIKTGASIVPMFTVRTGKENHSIIIEKPLELKLTGDDRADIKRITGMINGIIEKYIRKYPEQWWWFHDRWKRKPENID